jgi:hypothetical protein
MAQWRTLVKRTAILAFVVILVDANSACRGNGQPADIPPPFSAPAAEPVADSPTPITPTSTAPPTVDYAFADAIPAGERDSVKAGIDIALAYFSGLGTPLQQSVTVQVRGDAGDCPYTATASQHMILVCGASDVWRGSSQLQRSKILVHELYHVVQFDLGSARVAPWWIIEGSAEYVAYSAVIDHGLISRDAANIQLGLSGRRPALDMIHSTLRELEPEAEWFAAINAQEPTYALAYAAIELLVTRNSLSALRSFFSNLVPGADWRILFLNSFGVSVDALYDEVDKL